MASYPGYAGPMGLRSPIFGSPMTPPNLLGLTTDPNERRMRQLQGVGDTLTALGIGLMGQGTSTTPQSPLQGLAQGLAGAQQMSGQRAQQANQDERMDLARGQYGMEQQKFQDDQKRQALSDQYEQSRKAEMEHLIATLPADQQAAARANPEAFWKAYAESKFPKASEKKLQTIRRGNQDESGYFDESGKWTPVSSGDAFAPRQENSEYGLQPFITKDKDGNLHAFQLNKSGGMQEIPVPEGQSVTQQISMFDNGTTGVPVGKLSGPQPAGIASIPKDIAGEASAKVQGTAQGEAAAALPSYAAKASTVVQQVDELAKDPGIEAGTGKSAWLDPRNFLPGTEAYAFKQRVKQLTGGVFLQAYQDLRGGGAITGTEGDKAQASLARMETAQSREDFVGALNDFKAIVNKGLAVAKQRAVATPVPPGGDPASNGADAVDPLGLRSVAP